MKNDILIVKKNSPAEKAKRLIELQTLYKQIKPEIDALKEDLLEVMHDQDVLTLKTGTYTLSRATKRTPFVADFDLLKRTLEEQNIPYETQEVFIPQMNVTFKMAMEEGRDLPGLEGKTTEYISVRVKEKKEEKNDN